MVEQVDKKQEAEDRVRALITALWNEDWKFTNVDVEPERPGYSGLISVTGIEATCRVIAYTESSIVWLEDQYGMLNWFVITPGDEEEMLGMCSNGMSQSLIALRPKQ